MPPRRESEGFRISHPSSGGETPWMETAATWRPSHFPQIPLGVGPLHPLRSEETGRGRRNEAGESWTRETGGKEEKITVFLFRSACPRHLKDLLGLMPLTAVSATCRRIRQLGARCTVSQAHSHQSHSKRDTGPTPLVDTPPPPSGRCGPPRCRATSGLNKLKSGGSRRLAPRKVSAVERAR